VNPVPRQTLALELDYSYILLGKRWQYKEPEVLYGTLVPDTDLTPKYANNWRTLLLKQEAPVVVTNQEAGQRRSWIIGLTSLFFILLQSACTAFMAISGLRLIIGVASLAAATASTHFLESIHGESIRIPMEILAIAGSVVNLYAIWRVRSLRARPSSQWRVGPVSPKKQRAESIQIVLAILTLLLVGVEWGIHIHLHGSI
jgi:hypothetical protein